MVSFQDFLSFQYGSNSGQDFLTALAIFIGLFILLKLFDSIIIKFLKKTAKKTKVVWDDMVIDFLGAIHWQFYAYIAFYVGTRFLNIPEFVDKSLWFLLLIFIFFYVSQGLSRVVDLFTKRQLEKIKEGEEKANASMIKTFAVIFKIAIYAVALLMILDNLGIEITPLVASLGIGGIAIALALQTVLGDLFSAFAIYFDKPFKEGDFIIIGNDMGTVKDIGIKTTRIQTLQGQELIVSNTELTSTRVNNYKRMETRRIAFTFGVEYSTPLSKMKKINSMVKKAVESTKDAKFDRCHFKAFGDFSLVYECVYYVQKPDYATYMDVQQEINFKIKESFEKAGIGFAFPTQTLHLEGLDKKKK